MSMYMCMITTVLMAHTIGHGLIIGIYQAKEDQENEDEITPNLLESMMVPWIVLLLMIALFFITLVRLTKVDMRSDVILNNLQNKEEPETDRQCNLCNLYKRHGMEHCSTCKFCVDGFDHHCGVVEMCVGDKNMRLFAQLLVNGGS